MPSGDGFQITLGAVINGSPENEEFYRYTPAGQISLGLVSEAAAAQFEVGAEYFVDFTPAH